METTYSAHAVRGVDRDAVSVFLTRYSEPEPGQYRSEHAILTTQGVVWHEHPEGGVMEPFLDIDGMVQLRLNEDTAEGVATMLKLLIFRDPSIKLPEAVL